MNSDVRKCSPGMEETSRFAADKTQSMDQITRMPTHLIDTITARHNSVSHHQTVHLRLIDPTVHYWHSYHWSAINLCILSNKTILLTVTIREKLFKLQSIRRRIRSMKTRPVVTESTNIRAKAMFALRTYTGGLKCIAIYYWHVLTDCVNSLYVYF